MFVSIGSLLVVLNAEMLKRSSARLLQHLSQADLGLSSNTMVIGWIPVLQGE